jgi:plasmid maintenance system antidote protein VapI
MVDRVLALRLKERPGLSPELTINLQPQVEFA